MTRIHKRVNLLIEEGDRVIQLWVEFSGDRLTATGCLARELHSGRATGFFPRRRRKQIEEAARLLLWSELAIGRRVFDGCMVNSEDLS